MTNLGVTLLEDRVLWPKARDPRLVTIRRGATLTDADHRLLPR